MSVTEARPEASHRARAFDRVVGASLTDGAPHARRTLAALAAVLVLDWADRNVLGGVAPELKHDLGISNSQLGVLAAAFSIVGGVATLPLGMLVDRWRRMTLLSCSVVLWSIGMLAAGAAQGFAFLLGARLLVGAIAASAGPTSPSLVGDLVPEQKRGRVMSFVDGGQLVGTGLGYVLSAVVIAVLSWRWGFWFLGAPGLLLALLLFRTREPARTAAATAGRADRRSQRKALRTILSIRTNVIVIVAASVGNLFFAAVSTFAVVFVTQQYRVSTSQADLGVLVVAIGAISGIVLGGRLGDWLMQQRSKNGRLYVSAAGLAVAAVCGVPVLFLHSIPLAALLIVVGTGALNASTPLLDAIRLDVVPPDLRGRAEGVRTAVRTAVEGFAPLAIGVLADHLAGGGHRGLQLALLLVMPALALNGLLLLVARKTYPMEAAAVSAQAHAVGST